MINRQALLADLQKFLQRIEADLLERSESTEVPEVPAALRAEYEKASRAERTAQNYEDWRTDTITQAAAAWVLSCVFVRFLEDNSLIDPPKMSGPLSLVTGHSRLQRARDEHELYFRKSPQHSDREYLLSIFNELKKLPGTRELFTEFGKQLSVTNDKGRMTNDQIHWLSGDAAGELLNFFQKIDASTGDLVHDFTDPNWDTRFLGDLYQDLSEAARKKFALLQTPDFVEEFILDRTLEPALDEFGVEQDLGSSNHGKLPGFDDRDTLRIPFKMIDPACGSGHFLLGAFPRLLNRWQRKEPGTNIRELTQRALNSIHGVDINPFAVAIAKFRLLLVAMKSCDIQRLADAPAFQVNVACGDSLLHGENRTSTGQTLMDFAEGATDQELYAHAYPGEDLQRVRNLLRFGTYHCVVANPPYIVPKDRKLNDWYRKRFSACHMKYSLAVPFMQQIFQLAQQGGFTGQITANSFMKREFGKKLIESFFPTVDLTHVIDTSGAYIPGHGTPTAILFGRQREPIGNTLRTVLGIRGEPSTPDNPAKGQVWTSITNFIDKSGEQDSFVSSGDSDRVLFCRHPWSIGGGGASELKELIDAHCDNCLGDHVTEAGIMGVTGLDDAFVQPRETFFRMNCRTTSTAFILGEHVRDWGIDESNSSAFWPYDSQLCLVEIANLPSSLRFVWCYKSWLLRRKRFGTPMVEKGAAWYEWQELYATKLRSLQTIAFSNVATHNHFTLSLDGSLFNSHGMALKLPEGSTRSLYLKLLGALNSSAGCFWIKQVAHNKGSTVDKAGARQRTMPFEDFFETGATLIRSFPIPSSLRECLAVVIDSTAVSAAHCSPKNAIKFWELGQFPTLADSVSASHRVIREHAQRLVHYQEELDWESYSAFGILPSLDIYGVDFQLSTGQRAFEIDLARRIASGETQSTWFERHSSTPITELPKEWPEDYKQLVERRIELIQKDPNLRLIEQPEYKRRWNTEPWESQLERVLREWLLLRLETYFDFDGRMTDVVDASNRRVPLGEIAMYTVVQLADTARRDPKFMEVGELYRDDPAFDVQVLVEELVLAESVPHLPILRYKDSGLRKRAEWEKTWDLQRREDAMSGQLSVISAQLKAEKVEKKNPALQAEFDRLTTENRQLTTSIPVPPKYTSADFISTGGARYWSLRGKLDVPKERWISFPHCEGPDGTLVICWAGYDHLQQAQAISAYYVRVQTEFGGSDDPRLIPLLASLIELLPWLAQWHNEPNANFDGLRMGDYFESFVNEEARNLGKTLAEIKAWVPPVRTATRSRKKSK